MKDGKTAEATETIDPNIMSPACRAAFGMLLLLCGMIFLLAVAMCCGGCTAYRGGKVVDGSNIEVGMTIPGTEWNINFLSYTGGAKICGNDGTAITVTNTTAETNSYFFGMVETRRRTKLTAEISPVEQGNTAIEIEK